MNIDRMAIISAAIFPFVMIGISRLQMGSVQYVQEHQVDIIVDHNLCSCLESEGVFMTSALLTI